MIAPAAQQLLDQIDLVRLRLTPDGASRAALGQVLTPAPLARLMARQIEAPRASVALLDPGAGIGTLSAAAVVALCERPEPPRVIAVTACEVDERLLPHLSTTLALCADLCAAAGVAFDCTIIAGDFLSFAATRLEPVFAAGGPGYDVAILNPPYRKIQTSSRERRLLRKFGVEVSNLYAGFAALALMLLRPQGELVAITPRSFCNGPYFRPFRELLLANAASISTASASWAPTRAAPEGRPHAARGRQRVRGDGCGSAAPALAWLRAGPACGRGRRPRCGCARPAWRGCG